MPDQLTDRARKAAEERCRSAYQCDGECPKDDACSIDIRRDAAIIERNMREMTIVELGQLVQQREKWLQKEIDAGRWFECQGELWNPDRLAELEKELREGCELIETVMHQYDEA